MKKMIPSVLVFAAASALGTASCGDEDKSSDPTTSQPAPTTRSDGATPAAKPSAFLAMTRVFSPSGGDTVSYVQVLSSLDEGTTLDTKQAMELQGAGKVFSIEGLGWFALGAATSPTLTRYTLSDDNKLQKQTELSLQPYGVQSFFADKLYVVSPTKAYYPHPGSKQIVIINPTEMKIAGSIALPQTAREGFTAIYSYDYVSRPGKILFSIGWYDWENSRISPETGLVVIDTATDTVARYDIDERCGGIVQPVTVATGDTYFASSAQAGAAFAIGRLSTEPCALRIKAGDDKFDPNYLQSLRALTGGQISGEPIPGGGNAIFLRVYDDKMKPVTDDFLDLAGQNAWSWVRWDVASNQVTSVPQLAPSTADTVWFQVGGRVFGVEAAAEYVSSKLIDLTAEGGPRPAASTPGLFGGLAKIR